MRRRILLLTLGMTTLVVLAFAIPLAILITRETAQRAQQSVQNQAQFTAFNVRSLATPTGVLSYIASADATHHTSTLVQLADGSTVGSVPAGVAAAAGPNDATRAPPSFDAGGQFGRDTGAPQGNPGGPGGQLINVANGKLAVGLDFQTGVRVLVYATDGALRRGANGWLALLGGASAGLLLLAAAAAVIVSRRISAPLTRTAVAAHQLSVGDIDARAPTTGPREVAEVGLALNRLAGRIDELIGDERETVADLSHRMRTPLTALRLDVDALRDPQEAERIGDHVASLERTLTAVIRAARRPEREGLAPACDATAVVQERTAFWSALAEDQGRAFTRTLPTGPIEVRAAASDLAAAVDALVENVLAHTPDGVDFRVDLRAHEVGALLVVADAGPGIPEGAGVRGRSDRGSTGLGLSIAAQCAEISGGSLEIERPAAGGSIVRLTLGRP